eukprot:361368-Chlamydomonas_euryale.AAC.5
MASFCCTRSTAAACLSSLTRSSSTCRSGRALSRCGRVWWRSVDVCVWGEVGWMDGHERGAGVDEAAGDRVWKGWRGAGCVEAVAQARRMCGRGCGCPAWG